MPNPDPTTRSSASTDNAQTAALTDKGRLRSWRAGKATGFSLAMIAGIAMLLRLSASGRTDPATLTLKAIPLMDRNPAEAKRMLCLAIEESGGSNPRAEVQLCLLQIRRDDWVSGLKLYSGLNHELCSDDFLIEFGGRAHRAGKVSHAVEALNVVGNRKSPFRLKALDLLQKIHTERGEDREMLDCLAEMAQLTPTEPALWWHLLRLLDDRHLTTESIAHLERAVAQQLPQRDHLELRHLLITRLVTQGRIAEAHAALKQLPAAEQSSTRADRHRAALFRLEGKPQLALEALIASQSMTEEQPGIAWLRGQIHFDLRQFDMAVRDFQTVLKADPYDLTVHLKIADAFRELNSEESAGQHTEAARSIREKRQRINALRQRAERAPQDHEVLQELAELHRQLNDARAAAYWQKRADDVALPTD